MQPAATGGSSCVEISVQRQRKEPGEPMAPPVRRLACREDPFQSRLTTYRNDCY